MKHSRTYLLVQASAAVDKAIAEPGWMYGLDGYNAEVQAGTNDNLFLWLGENTYCEFDVADRKELQAQLVDDWTMEQEMTT